MDEAKVDEFEFVGENGGEGGGGEEQEQEQEEDFPEKPKSWKTGQINLDDEIGMTGLFDGRKLLIVKKTSV
eukprot:750262-Hanusia_phi.AAC.1